MVKYEDGPVKWMVYPSIFFMVLGMIYGVYNSFNTFIFPDYFSGEYIHFGRVRPVHVAQVLFLWLLSANIGLFYFLVQRLCGVRLWSVRLAKWSCGLWWFSLIIATFSLHFGTNYGWEYDELPMWVWWIPVKPLWTLSWLLVVINIFATIANRRHEKMYVSLWYTMGTMVWATIVLFIGGYTFEFLPGGISRVNASFFYIHNLVGLIITPMGLAIAYYFLPKLADTPIYSHRLSMIGFWSIAFVYAWIGTHHIIHGPVSQWLQTTSIVFSIWLFIPVWTVVHNIFYTLKPQWNKYSQSVPIRFIIMGTLFYLITCVQGPLMALRNINEITSKTDWIIGHSHISIYATFTFFAIAGIYYVMPLIVNRPLWSERLASWHFSLNMFGSVFFLLSLWIGGFLQGVQWSNWATGSSYADFHNNLSLVSFLQTISDMYFWWLMRAIGGTIILVANILFIVNIYNTVLLKPAPQEVLA